MNEKETRVNSPEQLDQYIKLSNPGVWIILLAIVVLLVGFCIWGYFGKIDSKINTTVVSNNSYSYLFVKEEDIKKVKEGMIVEIGNEDTTYRIVEIDPNPERVTEDIDEYARHLGNFQIGEWVYKCSLDKRVQKGTYNANIIVESVSPMSFVFN